MKNNIGKFIALVCGVLCLVCAITTLDVHWVIAGAIFKVAAEVGNGTGP